MNKGELIKKIINIAGRVITVLSLIFVALAVHRLGFDFSSVSNVRVFTAVVIISSLWVAAGVFVQGLAWHSWLSFFIKKKPDTQEALCVYARANIGKYLPGNVMHYVERNLFAAKSGVPQSLTALSSVCEIGSQVVIAFVLAVVTAKDQIFNVMDELMGDDWRRIALIAAAVGIALLALIIALVWKKAGDKLKSLFAGYSIGSLIFTFIKAMALYMVVMIIGGVIMCQLYCFMGGGSLNLNNAFLIISGYVIAWVLGFVVPGAPGGIGVREFVLTMVLGPVVGTELILTLMVVHRLITIIGDFIAYLLQKIFSEAAARARKEKN